MFLSEGFEAVRLVMTQILLVGLKFHPSELQNIPKHLCWCAIAPALMQCSQPVHLYPRMAAVAHRYCQRGWQPALTRGRSTYVQSRA
jgi:hypothetical protein